VEGVFASWIYSTDDEEEEEEYLVNNANSAESEPRMSMSMFRDTPYTLLLRLLFHNDSLDRDISKKPGLHGGSQTLSKAEQQQL